MARPNGLPSPRSRSSRPAFANFPLRRLRADPPFLPMLPRRCRRLHFRRHRHRHHYPRSIQNSCAPIRLPPFNQTSGRSTTPRSTGWPLPALDPKFLGTSTTATLQPNELPLYHTTIHWMALAGSITGSMLSLIVIVPIAMFAAWKDFYWVWLLLIIPVGILLSAAITVHTSELVITDRRVLIKVGFVQRRTFEVFISKIESVAVFQSMVGRLFNYGTVDIRGTGGSSESFPTIADPLKFRDAIQRVQSDSEKS